ncbi:MAG: PASTA domain-containing protein [Candidatus Aerophobetes bacterium]|nr:PASTA domain-containing protein [Candidatus Aerophobetes bacterium]
MKSLLKGVGISIFLIGLMVSAAFLTLRVLVPPEKIEIPSVVGKDIVEALLILSKQDLALKVIEKRSSSQIPKNIVISQSPSPEVKVRKGREIRVIISKGAEEIGVPLLLGKKLREAEIYLSREGLKLEKVSYASSKSSSGEILAQDPPPEVEISRERGVNVLVSLGKREPHFCMLDFREKKLEEAKALLEKIPLNVSKIREVSSLEREGVIIGQSPAPGSKVSSKTSIEILISAPRKKESLFPKIKLVLSAVRVPEGFKEKQMKAVIVDTEGVRTMNYGGKFPGEEVWIISKVMGKGRVEIYIENELAKVIRVVE